MKEVLKREYDLLGKTRLSHIWHMTIDKENKPLIITDGALNVLPNIKTKMHILKNVINFSNRIGIDKPKVAILSATEEVLDSVPSSKEAAEITKLAKEDNLNADVFGPLAFDNSISKKSASIKGIKNIVAGEADVLLVPSVETGNALVKMLIYFCGACAAGVVIGGKVPVVITSRSDEAPARLASIAAAAAIEANLAGASSDRLVITTGTLPPITTPAAQAPQKYINILTKAFPVSTLGTNKTSASPATIFFIPLIDADFFEILLSKANGPKTSAFKLSSLASLVISAASFELGTLSSTSSVAERIATFGLSIPILFEKFITFFKICIFVFIFGNTFNAPSVIINGLFSLSIVMCQI